MRRIRVIPTILIKNEGLYKGQKFKNHEYVGDPINTVRIFNEKQVDEISILDISATPKNIKPNILKIADIASEAFMPLSYGGGISKIEEVDELFFNGIEKVILNSSNFTTTNLISEIANKYGNQSVVVSIDVKKNWLGTYEIYSNCGEKKQKGKPELIANEMENRGAGEIILTSIDREGCSTGYDYHLIEIVSKNISIPLVASGGASCIDDFYLAIKSGASAVSAGSMFVFQKPNNAVLISYPTQEELKMLFKRL
ncbi:MAG: AglZ/HisF2 family acetamidino modification protein [Bacteroidota bacterium]|jgi:cyclase